MLKIGLVQLSVTEGEIEKNRAHIRELALAYAKREVDLLCFPELCISGYDFYRAEHSQDEKLFFSALAKECNTAILAGICIKEDNTYYDAACMWDETGRLLGTYKKIHLWDKECGFFTRGEELILIPYRGWKIGLLICADMRFFEISTPLANMGADVIVYPSAWIDGWKDLLHLCARMRAAENQIYAVALNRASGDVRYCGGTAVMGPAGNVLCAIEDDREGYVELQLSKQEIQNVRDRLEWDGMKLPHIYQKYETYRYADKDLEHYSLLTAKPL